MTFEPYVLLSRILQQDIIDCGVVYGVKTSGKMLIFTVYVSPGTSKTDIENFIRKHFAWVRHEAVTPLVIVDDFNIDIAKPANKDWFLSLDRGNFGLERYNDPNQPTTPNRSCLDLFLAKNVAKVVAEPSPLYHSDHKAIITTIALK